MASLLRELGIGLASLSRWLMRLEVGICTNTWKSVLRIHKIVLVTINFLVESRRKLALPLSADMIRGATG